MICVLTVSCYMIMVLYYIVDLVIYCNYFDFFFSDELRCVKILSQFGADSGFDSDNKHKEIGRKFTHTITPI